MPAIFSACRIYRANRSSIVSFFAIALFGTTMLASTGVSAQAREADVPTVDESPPEVTFDTTLGGFTIELFPAKAPLTVANFLAYVDRGHYDGTLFHRVIEGFMVQGGGFDRALNRKATLPPVANESGNGLENDVGMVAMARTSDPDSAASQFFINLVRNANLDARGPRPGYTVFGRVSDGMDVVEKIAQVPTATLGQFRDMPQDDVVILSARRAGAAANEVGQRTFTVGEDFVVLEEQVATGDPNKIEVVEAFSYGCPYCYQLEPYVQVWRQQLPADVEFRQFHASWNDSMRLYAQVFLTARHLGILDRIHVPLFNALQAEQRPLRSPGEMADFFETYGVERDQFIAAFRSAGVRDELLAAERRVEEYKLSGVPQFVVNGKYRVDPVRAEGRRSMLDVVDFLVEKERAERSGSNEGDPDAR